ncbi:AAA family ATPase [Aerococcus urinaeequi]|uniref:AAA family ATPase n=1 Tax=Aerococcus urinaeequi TaxID=51665 RepID=UPI003AABC4B8
MQRYSYSRVDLYKRCPYHFKLRYLDKLTELPDYDNAANPLIIGTAMHKGIETENVDIAVKEYLDTFPGLNNLMIEEQIKLEYWIPKAVEFLKVMFAGAEFEHEYKINTDNFIGFVDLMAHHSDGTVSVVDFKYSNSIKNYATSGQLHIYKEQLEQLGYKVRDLSYLFIPKTSIRRKKDETTNEFRKRLIETMDRQELIFLPINYDDMEYVYFLNTIEEIENRIKSGDIKWERDPNGECFACRALAGEFGTPPNYLDAIQDEEGEIIMALPKNERREEKIDIRPDFWIYAESYVGKSTFVDNVENVLFINTDGNTDNTTAPVVAVADKKIKEGRRIKTEHGWQEFLDTVADLTSEENTFEAVAIDLVEDLYELCRTYVFDQQGWEHESDGEWGKGWGLIKTEFNNAIKRLKMLGYQIIYISKEKVETTKLKGGAEINHYAPNINDKQANFLSGTVDMTIRAYINADDDHVLVLNSDKDSFGGSRIEFKTDEIDLDYDQFVSELEKAQKGKKTYKDSRKTPVDEDDTDIEEVAEEKPKRSRTRKSKAPEDLSDVEMAEDVSEETDEKPNRKRRANESEEVVDDTEEQPDEEKPTRKRRSRKTEEEPEVDEEESDDAEDTEDVEVEEKPRRARRSRKVEEDEDEEEEITTTRRRRRSRHS